MLAVAMIESSLGATLMAAIGAAPLTKPGLVAALDAAIAMTTIAVWTQEEDGETSAAVTNPLQENSFPMNRHMPSRAGLDNGNDSWQVRSSFAAW